MLTYTIHVCVRLYMYMCMFNYYGQYSTLIINHHSVDQGSLRMCCWKKRFLAHFIWSWLTWASHPCLEAQSRTEGWNNYFGYAVTLPKWNSLSCCVTTWASFLFEATLCIHRNPLWSCVGCRPDILQSTWVAVGARSYAQKQGRFLLRRQIFVSQ